MKTIVAPSHYRYLILYFIINVTSLASLQLQAQGKSTAHVVEKITYANDKYVLITNLPELKAVFLHHNGMLTWKVVNEVNQDYYIIERSFNGRPFTKAGSVDAVNQSGVHEYRFLDYSLPTNGIDVIFYRLKQKDHDGNTAVSRLVALPIASHASAVNVFPNPVINEAGISITVEKPQHVVVKLLDDTGMHLQTQVYEVYAGSSSLSFDMSSFPAGNYILDINSGLVKKRLTIIKQ